ncbi:MAG: VWA domain-containing protein [Candidatus Eiseniibacteriota bacterium]
MFDLRPKLPAVFLFACALCAPAAPVSAGTGRVRATSPSTFILDFCVSVQFQANAAELVNIQRAITDASAVLADATDGQYAFGNVDIVNDSGAGADAEVWIKSQAGSAYGTPGLYGSPGEHITLYYPTNCTGTPALNGDAYTLAHEFGHHLWGLKDEYAGPIGAAECEPAPGSPSASFSLMDNFFARGGNDGAGTGTYTLNEFCVAANHDPDFDTAQQAKWGVSCWGRISAHPTRPAVHPVGLPAGPPPVVTAPVFRFPVGERRFVLLIDRSGDRPSQPMQLPSSQQAARLFVDLVDPGDAIAVVSFAGTATVDFPLTVIQGPAERAAAKAAIDALTVGGATSLGNGLIAARDEILAQSQASCTQQILLLSDGIANLGPPELSVVPSLVGAGIAVFPFALAQPPKPENLAVLAAQTGGSFASVSVLDELPGFLAGTFADTYGSGVATETGGTVTQGGTFTAPAFIEQGATRVQFVLFWADLDDLIDLTIEAPDGTVYSAADTTNPDVEFVSSPGVQVLSLGGAAVDPAGGEYKMIPGGTQLDTDGGSFCLSALPANGAVSMAMDVGQPTFSAGQPIAVSATPRFRGNAVVGSSLSGEVVLPSGVTMPIVLFDDGNPANGDDLAGDGVYGARVSSVGAGLYSFHVDAEAIADVTFGGEALYQTVGAPIFSETAPDFTRFANASAVVTDSVATGDPTMTCPPPVTAEATSASGASVTLSTDVADGGGQALTVTWIVDGTLAQTDLVPAGPGATVTLTRAYSFGAHPVQITVSDGFSSLSCATAVSVVDTTAPTLSVTLNRTVLFPPNRALMRVTATIGVSDATDPAPTFVLSSITSDEPDSGIGSGDVPNDIVRAAVGTPDTTFELRAERDPAGDGRVYSIVYTATDVHGNSASHTSLVTCAAGHLPGSALSATGFAADGTGILPGALSVHVVIPSVPGLVDAFAVDPSLVVLGNEVDVVAPLSTRFADVTGDALTDLIAEYPAGVTDALRAASQPAPVALYFETDAAAYLVTDVFALGPPVPIVSTDATAQAGSIDLYRPTPNPFTGTSRVAFAVPGSTPAAVTFTVFDVAGRVVRRIVEHQTFAPGRHDLSWDGRDGSGREVLSGVYLLRLEVGAEERTLRVVRLR